MITTRTLAVWLLGVAVLAPVAWCADNSSPAAPVRNEVVSSVSPAIAAAGASKSESPLLEFGFDMRTRTEDWNNVADCSSSLPDERHQVRFRSRTWLSLNSDAVTVYARLANEFKKQSTPELKFNLDEAFFDNLYVDIKKTPVKGLSMRIGRQDLMRGEGFLLYEGSATDGSRSFYFNAADVTYAWKKSKIELIGILNPRQERFLPTIHDRNKYLNEWDEHAVGAYYSNRERKNADVDAYYFFKREVNDYRAATHAQFQPDRSVHTVGARLARRIGSELTVAGEFAMQAGRQDANPAKLAPKADIRGFGGYVYAKKSFARSWHPYVLGGYWFLSGDDPSTTRVEGFDPLFSRYPKWSDLYIYSLTSEKGIGYWTNDRMVQVEVGVNPSKSVALKTALYSSFAAHRYDGNTAVFSTGTHRGELLQLRMDYTLSSSIKGHVTYETLLPGSFYTSSSPAYFFRAELMYSFKHSLISIRK